SLRAGIPRNCPRRQDSFVVTIGVGGRCAGTCRALHDTPRKALMDNREIARMLYETADLMEIAGEDGFRIRSYRNAAGVIEGYPEPVAAIVRDPNQKLTDIAGIGKSMAAAIAEIEQRGSFARRDEMLALYPPTALELLKIQGLGPKSIRALWDHYRVSTID